MLFDEQSGVVIMNDLKNATLSSFKHFPSVKIYQTIFETESCYIA
jgi:hypothetical protein